jgi:hypothetical protein
MTMIDPDSPLINKSVKAAIIANTPMTATKANIGSTVTSIVVVILYIFGRLTGLIEIPEQTLFADAVTTIVTAVVTWGSAWVSIYLARNTPKAHPLATCLAVGLSCAVVLALLGGCAATSGQQTQTPAQRTAGLMSLGLVAAKGLVALYAAQPACGTEAAKYVVVCSNPTISARLSSLLTLAQSAVVIFAETTRDPGASGDDVSEAEAEARARLSDLTTATGNATAGIVH